MMQRGSRRLPLFARAYPGFRHELWVDPVFLPSGQHADFKVSVIAGPLKQDQMGLVLFAPVREVPVV